jgi:hypothetical protein
MAASKRNQKQVVERLKGNLDYYNRLHPFRGLRGLATALSLIGGFAAIGAYYYLKAPEEFMNPGPISRAHAPATKSCVDCHINTQLIKADSHQAGNLLHKEYYETIDRACANCHKYFAFHAPNTVPDFTRKGVGAQNENSSCTACHREHLTAGKMAPTESVSCAVCHDRSDLMAASSKAGLKLAAKDFPNTGRNTGGLKWFPEVRPREGYTKSFAAFDKGHPDFQIHLQNLKDPDTLQYNHARHELGDIPKTEKGKKLDCNYCHKSDASGMNFQPITFENNCVACHALKFDPNTPEMVIPHGDPEKVRAFLRTLGNQYIELAIRTKGMNSQEATVYATNAVQSIAGLYGGGNLQAAGPKLEQQTFYSKEHVNTGAGALQRRSNDPGTGSSALFPGCAFCHQVSAQRPNVTPTITRAVIFDRWLGDGNFNHAKHTQQSCSECHNSVHASQLTSDINIPTQKSCTQCHNSKPGGVANDCMSCHHYHNDPRMKTVTPDRKQHIPITMGGAEGSGEGISPVRAMLLGRN